MNYGCMNLGCNSQACIYNACVNVSEVYDTSFKVKKNR
jgi:hypothetical protein